MSHKRGTTTKVCNEEIWSCSDNCCLDNEQSLSLNLLATKVHTLSLLGLSHQKYQDSRNCFWCINHELCNILRN